MVYGPVAELFQTMKGRAPEGSRSAEEDRSKAPEMQRGARVDGKDSLQGVRLPWSSKEGGPTLLKGRERTPQVRTQEGPTGSTSKDRLPRPLCSVSANRPNLRTVDI